MTIPEALTTTFDRWERAGRPTQVQSRWNALAWARQLPDQRSFIESLGTDRMDRVEAMRRTRNVVDEVSAVQAFLISMLWGYGPVGYGPFRTRRILERPESGAELLDVANTAMQEGGLAAFDLVATRRQSSASYLKWLGPAFGTKYIYFLTANRPGLEPAPVMDAVVRRWFRKHAPEHRLIVDVWHTPSYRIFLDCLSAWSDELQTRSGMKVSVDDVEYLIFAEGNRFEDNVEWRESWDAEQRVLSLAELFDQLRSKTLNRASFSGRATRLIDELESLLQPTDDHEERSGIA